MTRRYTTEEFIARAKAIHGDVYDYSEVVYKTSRDKVRIICLDHGPWETQPLNHVNSGSGCPECGKALAHSKTRNSEATVRAKIFKVHGNTYEYRDSLNYKNKDSKIEIKCSVHGWFEQSLNNHTQNKAGCQSCAKTGYDMKQPGYIYILRSGNITKVGITNLTAKRRSKLVSRSSGRTFEVAHEYYFLDGKIPSDIETVILRELRAKYSQPEEKFQGHSECFFSVDPPTLLNRIEQLIKEHTEAQNKAV